MKLRLGRVSGFGSMLRASAAAVAIVSASPVLAQVPSGISASVPADARLLLSANELTYNEVNQTVVASGEVRIDYGGYKMVADRVVYDQTTGRLKAYGSVEMVEPSGNTIRASDLDVTEDFADGFINALRIETADRTYIVAESAERRGGVETQLNNGVYTACEPCEEHPERAPLWQIKARRVIENKSTRTIELENARFEMFGVPLLVLPYLRIPDSSVKRKSGFLQPDFHFADKLGAGISVPYYHVIAPSADLTATLTGFTKQGFLAEGEFRQRFRHGTHTLKIAGIHQADPGAFVAGSSDALQRSRGFIASKARFDINPRWVFGWDAMIQTDNNFAHTYGIDGYSDGTVQSKIYLTGLSGRNYFDLRAFRFDVQDSDPTSFREKNQGALHPSLDYSYTFDRPLLGGEVNLDINERTLTRDRFDVTGTQYHGLTGSSTRVTGQLEWKREVIVPGGLVLTPLVAGRLDGFYTDLSTPTGFTYSGALQTNSSEGRGMVTAGLEARYPILATTGNSTHVFEPIAQIFVRPDEPLAGGLPNEDAQSFVFDATTLFERDKFSGLDRVEGGTRANVGLRYTGRFENGVSLYGIVGQSYQIAGLNSFTTPDLVNVGVESGLETSVSDFVGTVGISLPEGFSFSAGGRFDEKDLTVRRADLRGEYRGDVASAAIVYSRIEAQPAYGSPMTREEVKGAAALRLHENWTVFGNVTYDIANKIVTKDGVGFTYADECFMFTINYQQDRDIANVNANDWSVNARLSFRTLGNFVRPDPIALR